MRCGKRFAAKMADAEAKRQQALEAGRKALLKKQKKKASANTSSKVPCTDSGLDA
jgi:hypothetical protein